MKNKVNDELKQHFRPEFLNRIDDIVVFHQLTEPEIVQMVDLHDRPHREAAGEQGHGASSSPTPRRSCSRSAASTRCWAHGRCAARSSARSRTQLSEKILFDEIEPGQIVLVDVEGWTVELDDQGRTKPAPESAKFTFRGEPKPTPVPDTPEVATAGTSDAADS